MGASGHPGEGLLVGRWPLEGNVVFVEYDHSPWRICVGQCSSASLFVFYQRWKSRQRSWPKSPRESCNWIDSFPPTPPSFLLKALIFLHPYIWSQASSAPAPPSLNKENESCCWERPTSRFRQPRLLLTGTSWCHRKQSVEQQSAGSSSAF